MGVFDLSVKAVSADEFTDDARGGDLVLNVRIANVIEKSYHRAHLLVAFLARIDLCEKGIDIFFDHRQLIESGAVEDDVSIFLIGEYPSLLAASYGIPHIKRSLNARAAAFKIAHCAAEEP